MSVHEYARRERLMIPPAYRKHLDGLTQSAVQKLYKHYESDLREAWPYRDRLVPREMVRVDVARMRQIRAYQAS